MKCPWKDCGYIRKTTDVCPEWQCPSCQNAYNKHPDYNGNNYFEVLLTYKEKPQDTDIKPGKLYLYLADDEIEGAIFYKPGVIERVRLYERDLGKDFTEIKNILNNPPLTLTSDQEASIRIATARKKAQQIDEGEELKEQEVQKNKKLLVLIFSVVIFLIIIILYYVLSDDPSEKISTSTLVNSSNMSQQQATKSEPNNNINDAFLETNGIDLELIASKLDLANSLAKQCQSTCQSSHTIDDSCEKTNAVTDEISTQIINYKKYVQGTSVDRFSQNNKQLVERINQQLWSIPQELESAKYYCEHGVEIKAKEVISQPVVTRQEQDEKIDLPSMDIHLDIIYSKVYTADANIRDCRMRCEAHAADPTRNLDSTSCSLFLNIAKEYNPEIDKIMDVLKQSNQKISKEDRERIRQIFYLLQDIETERQHLVSCLRAL